VKWRVQLWLRRLGNAGVIGIGVLVACAGFWGSALAPAEQELAAQRLALERLKARTPYQPVSTSSRAEELGRFYALFPTAASLTDELERVHQLARRSGLELAQGEYRLERPQYGLWAYRVTLPVRGGYGQMRAFIAALLRDIPTASLEGLRFERRKAAETELDAQLRITLHLRPTTETP
jgi:Tfp pilus assembly protein PilO